MAIEQLGYHTDYLFNIVAKDKINLMINTINSGIPVNSIVVVSEPEHLSGALDSTKVYIIDGVVDFTGSGISVEVPETGIQFLGYGFNTSKIKCTDDNFTLFTSPVGGSGDILVDQLAIEVSGLNSKVFDIVDSNGLHAIEMNTVNYDNCTSLGIVDSYRQGLETGTGRFGGTPTLELAGAWLGGFRITTSIVRSLDAGMTTPLFKAGTGFVIQSRFLTDLNADLPTNSFLADFTESNFPNPSTLQINGAILSSNGVVSIDNNFLPNISSSSLSAYFRNNIGLENTYIGAKSSVSGELLTTINTQNVYETLLATWTVSELSHFDSPSSGVLRHLGDTPINFQLVADFTISGFANEVVEIDLVKHDFSTSTDIDIEHQKRQINNLVGNKDVGFFSFVVNFTLQQGDYIYFNVANESSDRDVTLLEDSYMFISER